MPHMEIKERGKEIERKEIERERLRERERKRERERQTNRDIPYFADKSTALSQPTNEEHVAKTIVSRNTNSRFKSIEQRFMIVW